MDQTVKDTIVRDFWADIQSFAPDDNPPLLAHYTSTQVLELIMKNDEVWMSNPLVMNDHEEVAWGLRWSHQKVMDSPLLKSAFQPANYVLFQQMFGKHVEDYGNKYLFNTYILCFSEHDANDDDGILSMWRGYGGNGTGAAVVIDPSKLNRKADSPLIFAKVTYGTRAERFKWIDDFIANIASAATRFRIAGIDLGEFAYLAFERIKIAALFSKHKGFSEEREWRVVYMAERDQAKLFVPFYGYFNGPCGLEPKLKLKIAPNTGVLADDLSLDRLIERIIVGPQRTSPLVMGTTERMLEQTGKAMLKPRLKMSDIPFRSRV